MSKETESGYLGQCFCGAVKVHLTGAPFAMGYCHCEDCRAWSASPVSGFTLWAVDAVQVTEGKDKLANFAKTEGSQRKFCAQCGGHVYSEHPLANFIDVYSSILPTLEFSPELHVNYASAVLKVRDGLPKLKDFPKEMGGSGELVPE